MALLTRLSRLLQADLHAVLDQIEQPDILLKQSIREMEIIIAEDEQQILELTKLEQELNHKEVACQQSLDAIAQKLDICFSSQQDDLARLKIKRKLEIQKRIKQLTRDQSRIEDEISVLKTELERKRLEFDSLLSQADVLLKTSHYDDQNPQYKANHEAVRDEDIEIAFLHEQQIRSKS